MSSDDGIFRPQVAASDLKYRNRIANVKAELREAVEKEKRGEKKIPIAVLAITHADRDHITIRKKLRERFDIGLLIDSGRDYDAATDCMKDFLQYRKQMRDAGKYRAFPRAKFNVWPDSGAAIDVLCPNRDVEPSENNNNQCMVKCIEHNGWSFLFTGDSPWEDWADVKTGILALHGATPHSHILNASHHGSRTFFTPSGQRGPASRTTKRRISTAKGFKMHTTGSFIYYLLRRWRIRFPSSDRTGGLPRGNKQKASWDGRQPCDSE